MTIRQAIRAAYLHYTIPQLLDEAHERNLRGEKEARDALDEMIDECRKHKVYTFADCPL